MKKVIASIILSLLIISSISFAYAISNNSNNNNFNSTSDDSEDDETDNDFEDDNETSDDSEDDETYNNRSNRERNENEWKERARIRLNDSENCPSNCSCQGSTTKCNLSEGRQLTIRAGNSGNVIIVSKNINASTNVELYRTENGTLVAKFKNNQTKEIILPEKAQERLEEKLQKRIEARNITLDENGIYRIEMQKKSRLFFLFQVNEKVQAEINAENGETIKIRNPWWGFLAKDLEE